MLLDIKESVSLNQKQLSILVEPRSKEEDFRFHMLQGYQVHYLLPIQKFYEDGMVRYLYNATEKETFPHYCKGIRLKEAAVKQFMIQLLEALVYGKEYYLEEDSYLVNPEYIYLDVNEGRYFFCYCPDFVEPIRQQISNVVGFLMNQVDYEDLAAVKLVYQLYQMLGEDSFSTKKILTYVRDYHFEQENQRVKQSIITLTPELEMEFANPLVKINNVEPPPARILPQADEPRILPQVEEPSQTEVIAPKGTIIFILSSVAFLILFCLGYVGGLFYTRIGHQLDLMKIIVFVVMMLLVEGVIAWKVFGEKEDISSATMLTSYRLLPCSEGGTESIWLNQFPFSIGKDSEQPSGILRSVKVSRQHAVFSMEGGNLYLKDRNSLNGTYVNDKRLLPENSQVLRPGDYIRFADVMYQLGL